MAFKEFLRPRHLILTNLIILSAIGGLFSLMNGVVSSYLTMLGDLRSIDNASLFFTVSSIAVLLIRPFSGKMADRKGLMYVMIPSLLLGASSMFCISSAWSIAPILTAALLKGAAQSSGQNAIQAECARRSPANRRGVAMSTCYLGNDLGNSFGAMLGGWLSGSVGYGKMFGIIGGIMADGPGNAVHTKTNRCSKRPVEGSITYADYICDNGISIILRRTRARQSVCELYTDGAWNIST